MELFKFNYTTDPTVLELGEPINGATSIMWVERYLDPGEFEIQAQLSSGLADFLPIGTLISHIDTLEVMIVENLEINEDVDSDPTIKISGRSFETVLENRIVGMNQVRASSSVTEYILAADNTWKQAVQLINDHIVTATDTNDRLTNVVAEWMITGSSSIVEARPIPRDTVHKGLLDILAVEDLGVKTIRRNTFPDVGISGDTANTIICIYYGEDKSDSIIFSWKSGDLESANYLFTNKKLKNSALVLGKFINVPVDTGATKYNRRIMVVDATDIDGHLSDPPTGAALTTILTQMTTRGIQALFSQPFITIGRTDIANVSKYQHRIDFNVGDLVSIDGNYGQIQVMRIIEFTEIQDENGESGHPTLGVPGG